MTLLLQRKLDATELETSSEKDTTYLLYMERCHKNNKATVMVQKIFPFIPGNIQQKSLFPTIAHTHGEFLAYKHVESNLKTVF